MTNLICVSNTQKRQRTSKTENTYTPSSQVETGRVKSSTLKERI